MKNYESPNEAYFQLSADAVLNVIRANPAGLSAQDLATEFQLNRAQQKQLQRILGSLQGTGIIRRTGNDYRWADAPRVLLGTIRQRRRNVIFFVPEDEYERARGKIRIESEAIHGAYDGDRVIIQIVPSQGQDRAGKVLMVLTRGILKIVGRLHIAHRFHFIESLDERFPHEIDVQTTDEDEDGKIVVVQLTRYPSAHESAAGTIIERLGAFSTEPGLDIEIIIRKHDLPHVFPPEVEAEAGQISPVVTPEQCAGRLDLRSVLTVTIDGETARDFDDAISLQELANGHFSLGVHIADVSFYVRENSALDHEARLRGTSVYFPERAIPMLPESLSNGICSLNPHVDRLALSALMEVNPQGKVISYQLRETVICSAERMTYTDVNKVLAGNDATVSARYASLATFFQTMEKLARCLIKVRAERGAIDFNMPEAVFRFNDEGQIAGVAKSERNIAHRIIEEFMLLANETVATHLELLRVPSLYRIHEPPEPQRVIEFAQLAASYGYRFPVEGVKSFDYQRLSHLLTNKPEEKVLSYAMLRSLQRARYAASNVGHFGLAAPTYTHFTSPIRRYPDLIVHRILRALLQHSLHLGDSTTVQDKAHRPRNPVTPLSLQTLTLMADEASERERSADAAENELEQWRKAALMAEHIGEIFEGLIVSVREFGFFVELDDLFIEGLVAVGSLQDDYYQFDARRHALVGNRLHQVFRLGDRVKVRVDRVNVDRHLVDFSVIRASKKGSPLVKKVAAKQKRKRRR